MPDYKSHIPKPVMGLAIVCVAFGISGLFRTIALTGYNTEQILETAPNGQLTSSDRQLLTVLFGGLIRQILQLAAGLSLLLFKPWSRLVALVYAAFAIGYTITAYFVSAEYAETHNIEMGSGAGAGMVIQMSIPIIAILILMNGRIIQDFRRGRRAPDKEKQIAE